MSAPQDRPTRVPPGGGIVLGAILSLFIWAGLALIVFALRAPDPNPPTQETSHADQ